MAANATTDVLRELAGLRASKGRAISLYVAHYNLCHVHESLSPSVAHQTTPAMALKDGKPAFAYGTSGGDGQPYTVLQLHCNLLAFGMDPQEAQDAPRWTIEPAAAGPFRSPERFAARRGAARSRVCLRGPCGPHTRRKHCGAQTSRPRPGT